MRHSRIYRGIFLGVLLACTVLVATAFLMFNDYIKTKEAQAMLNENIKNLRKAKGLSQEELANRLNVVRQTVSKWEKGLSVPDSSMLISLADELDTSVSILLGETVPEHDLKETDLKSISGRIFYLHGKMLFAKNFEKRRNSHETIWNDDSYPGCTSQPFCLF